MKKYYLYLKKNLHTFDWFSSRTINSFKTALACLIGYLLVLFAPLPQAQWIVITILIVMCAQISVGGMIIKSYMRFLGTIFGASIAASIIFFHITEPFFIACTLFIFSFLFAYLATSSASISEAGTLGIVTIAMILLNPTTVDMTVAAARFVEITLGLVIAFLISNLVLPIRAHKLLLHSFSSTSLLLQEHFQRCLSHQDTIEIQQGSLEQKISQAFQNQRKLLREMSAEPGKYQHQKSSFQEILNCLLKIYRAMNLMYYSAHASEDSATIIHTLDGITSFKQEVGQLLLQLSEIIRSGNNRQTDSMLTQYTDHMESAFKKVFHEKKFEHVAAVNAFLFGAKLLVGELKTMLSLLEKIKK